MHGFAICVSYLTARARCQVRWYQDSCIREAIDQDGIQDDQDHYDLETDLAFSSVGDLVFLLQVSHYPDSPFAALTNVTVALGQPT